MNWVDIVTAVVTFLIAPTTAVLTWKLSRRKTDAEVDTTIAEGAKTTVDAMLSVMNELRAQIQFLHEEAEELRRENQELMMQVSRLQETIDSWEKNNVE